jgi:2-dehydropantoate 2-reductase
VSRVAVIGAGAIGSVLASQLTACGHDVTLCVRTPIDGVRVDGPLGVGRVPAFVTTDPAEVGPVEWAVLAVKVQDTAGAEPWLARLGAPGTDVLVAQNGVGHRERVAPLAPAASVLPALVNINMETLSRTHFRHRVSQFVTVPAAEPASERLVALLDGGGIEVRREADFHTAVWRKLLGNLAANPITALSLRRLEVFADDAVAELGRRLLREAIAVGRAEGAALEDADVERTFEAFTMSPNSGTSMLFDRLEGRRLEHEQLTGHVVRCGRRHGIPTPIHDTLLPLLAAIDGRTPLGSLEVGPEP